MLLLKQILLTQSIFALCINSTETTLTTKIKTTTTKFTPTTIKTTIKTTTKTTISTNLPDNVETEFVVWNGQDFMLNNKKFAPVGFNAYWLGLHEDFSYPTHPQIEEMFIIAKELGATVIRSHTLGFSSGSQNALRPFDNNLNNRAWEPIDYAFSMANKYNIKLITPLTDSYNYYHGSYGDFSKTRGVSKPEFWTNLDVRNDFKDYINKWLNHVNSYTGVQIKNDPALLMIELGNELGNYRPGADSVSTPTKDWIGDISSYIKSIDKNHMILNGVDESLGLSDDFNIKSLDVFSSHFYWKDYNRINNDAQKSKSVGKPYIIGEYDSKFENDWFNTIEEIPNVKGSVFWTMYPHYNGYKSGQPMPHIDGFTLHYPENSVELDRISQHFKRMTSF